MRKSFIDNAGNHYTASVEYQLNPLMQPDDYEKYFIDYIGHPMLLLHFYDRFQNNRIVNEKSIALRKQILKLEGMKERCRTDCLQTLVEFYYENYNDELLENYLKQIDLNKLLPAERNKFLEYMIIRSYYEESMEALKLYGYEKLPVNRLVKLCSGWISSRMNYQTGSFTMKNDKDSSLIDSISYYVFLKGKYDETILQYLVEHYYGATTEMFQIWHTAKSFELKTHRLEERLLTQILFSESYVQDSYIIFSEYYKEVTNHLLVRAFLSFYAYRYLVHDRLINTELFSIMKRELNYEENDVCLIAWLKFNISNNNLNENELKFIEYSIYRLEKKDIILPFFAQYRKTIKLSDRLTDKCYVEYKTDPQKQDYIHYRILKESMPEDFITERMPDIYLGIHVKEFVLYYHEILQYYITEEFHDEVNITESFNLRNEQETPEEEESNYNQINLMLLAMEMKDEKTLLELMEHYVKTQYMILKCFQPMD
jgi:hypothetical protein